MLSVKDNEPRVPQSSGPWSSVSVLVFAAGISGKSQASSNSDSWRGGEG
jgi:hypothetical protein